MGHGARASDCEPPPTYGHPLEELADAAVQVLRLAEAERAVLQVQHAGEEHDQGGHDLVRAEVVLHDHGADEGQERAAQRRHDALRHRLDVLEDAADRQALQDLQRDDLHALGLKPVEKVGGAEEQVRPGDQKERHREAAARDVDHAPLQVDVDGRPLLHGVLRHHAAGGRQECQDQHPHDLRREFGRHHDWELADGAPDEDPAHSEPLRPRKARLKQQHPQGRVPEQPRLAEHAEGGQRDVLYGLVGDDVGGGVDEARHRKPAAVLHGREGDLLALQPPGELRGAHQAGRDDQLGELHDEHGDGRVEVVPPVASPLRGSLHGEVDRDREQHEGDAAHVGERDAREALEGVRPSVVGRQEGQGRDEDDARSDAEGDPVVPLPALALRRRPLRLRATWLLRSLRSRAERYVALAESPDLLDAAAPASGVLERLAGLDVKVVAARPPQAPLGLLGGEALPRRGGAGAGRRLRSQQARRGGVRRPAGVWAQQLLAGPRERLCPGGQRRDHDDCPPGTSRAWHLQWRPLLEQGTGIMLCGTGGTWT
mmetsp:Transcript_62058/g.161204  ORF Transcript_62058/g.161204 Transcript_62058/m.161204 type:complete len:542 (-) Transcript_62058:12-1637(-)